jgi:hypothetical protein
VHLVLVLVLVLVLERVCVEDLKAGLPSPSDEAPLRPSQPGAQISAAGLPGGLDPLAPLARSCPPRGPAPQPQPP